MGKTDSQESRPLDGTQVVSSVSTGGGGGVFQTRVGALYLANGIVNGSEVEGWTTVIVLLAFLNGVAIAMLSMLGEYMVRTLRQVSDRRSYLVADRVDGRRP